METGKPPPLSPSETAPPGRPIDLIVLHCSATPSGQPLQRGVRGRPGFQDCAEIIDAWHGERGFARNAGACAALNPRLPHIGYHYVIDLSGELFHGRGLGEVGAHVAGHNAHSIGICLVGGVEREGRYTSAQWESLAKTVTWQASVQRVPLAPPLRNGDVLWRGVCGHRDLSPDTNQDGVVSPTEWLKTCPGFDVAAWLGNGLRPLDQHLWRPAV